MRERILTILTPDCMEEATAERIADLVEKFVSGIYPRESGVRLIQKLISDYSITGDDKAFLESVAASFPQRT